MRAFIISAALDTNGQNARFVRAAAKHGRDVIRSFAIGSSDPAGVVGRFQLAAEKTDDLIIRSAHRIPYNEFQFPADLEWNKKTEPLIRDFIREADIVHLNNSFRAMQHFGIRKPTLLHHHGTLFRSNPAAMLSLAKAKRAGQAVSTVDLLKPAPDVLRWLPSAYDIDELQRIARKNRRKPDGRIRIVHAPTQNGIYKNTPLFVKVVKELQKDFPIDLVLVSGMTNAECMAEKAKADIVYDQMMFGYGCNSIEAWGLGAPVVAGADPWTIARMRELWGTLPFAEAEEKTLKGVLKGLVQSSDMRAEYAARGLAHVRKYHDEKPALATLMELYHDAMEKQWRPRIKGKGVMFQHRRKMLIVDGQRLDFSTGTLEVTDVEVVRKLRDLQRQRPTFGVKEIA